MEGRKRKRLLLFSECVDVEDYAEKESVKTQIKKRGKKLKVKRNENYFNGGGEVK